MYPKIISLDSILSAAHHFAAKWAPLLKRSQAHRLLRLLLIKLYNAGRGNLHTALMRVSQETLAQQLGLSRRWVGVLLHRLERAGWITSHSGWADTNMRETSTFRAGRQAKRLLALLLYRRKSSIKSDANSRSQVAPPRRSIKDSSSPVRPLSEAVLARLPLLRVWLSRE
jgi:hypothetical protein